MRSPLTGITNLIKRLVRLVRPILIRLRLATQDINDFDLNKAHVISFNYYDADFKAWHVYYLNKDRFTVSSKAEPLTRTSTVVIHFPIDDEDRAFDPEYPTEEGESDLEFTEMPRDFGEFLKTRPRVPIHSVPGRNIALWKNYCQVDRATNKVIGYW